MVEGGRGERKGRGESNRCSNNKNIKNNSDMQWRRRWNFGGFGVKPNTWNHCNGGGLKRGKLNLLKICLMRSKDIDCNPPQNILRMPLSLRLQLLLVRVVVYFVCCSCQGKRWLAAKISFDRKRARKSRISAN